MQAESQVWIRNRVIRDIRRRLGGGVASYCANSVLHSTSCKKNGYVNRGVCEAHHLKCLEIFSCDGW